MARRLPSSLSICLRSCQLYRAGQTCYDCPNRGQSTCPLPDIEDLFTVKNRPVEQKAARAVQIPCQSVVAKPTLEFKPCTKENFSKVSDECAINLAGCLKVQKSTLPVKVLSVGAVVDKIQKYSPVVRQPTTVKNQCSNVKPGSFGSHFFSSLGLVRSLAGIPSFQSRSFSVPALLMPEKTLDISAHILRSPKAAGYLGNTTQLQWLEPDNASKLTLENSVVPMSSTHGRVLFTEALAAGGLESYFPLSEQYLTQTDPTLTAVSSLAMVLNALNHDPQRTWKGPWRWNSEEVVQCVGACGHSLETLRKGGGVELAELAAMARCKGVRANPVHSAAPANAGPGGLARFRRDVSDICNDPSSGRLAVVRFSRSTLGLPQVADDPFVAEGHFSPIGGYHAGHDMVLVLDVSRHRSPPFWVPIADLWASMQAGTAGDSRGGGYVTISTIASAPAPAAISPAWAVVPGSPTPSMCPLMIRSWSEHVAGGHCCKGGERTAHRGAGARRRAPRRPSPAATSKAVSPRRDGLSELLSAPAPGGVRQSRPLHTSRPQRIA
jgi:hypothetical protein